MCVLVVSTIAAPAARAADEFKPFTYVSVGASRSLQLFEERSTTLAPPGTSAHVGNTWGANAHAGYRFNKYLAAEVEYEWTNDFHMRVGGVAIGQLQTQVATANLKVVAPFGAIEPYFTVGFGALWTTISSKPGFAQYDVANGVFTGRSTRARLVADAEPGAEPGRAVVVNNAKVTGPISSNEGIDYLTGQFGFGYRF